METMEYSKVGLKDIFKSFANFFKQQSNNENTDIERQIAEIKSAEEKGPLEQLEKEINTHEIEKTKKNKILLKNSVSRKKEVKVFENKKMEKEQDIESEK